MDTDINRDLTVLKFKNRGQSCGITGKAAVCDGAIWGVNQ